MPGLQLLGEGLIGSLSQIAVIGGTLVLVLMLVAMAGFAYKQLWGDGVEWPDEDDEDETLSRGDADDEWDYY